MSDGDGEPTVKNEGNERIMLSVESTELVGEYFGKTINDFDVKWDPEEVGFGYGQVYYNASETVVFDIDPLELCQTEKIDFSVHADVGLPQDNYVETLTVGAEAFDDIV